MPAAIAAQEEDGERPILRVERFDPPATHPHHVARVHAHQLAQRKQLIRFHRPLKFQDAIGIHIQIPARQVIGPANVSNIVEMPSSRNGGRRVLKCRAVN